MREGAARLGLAGGEGFHRFDRAGWGYVVFVWPFLSGSLCCSFGAGGSPRSLSGRYAAAAFLFFVLETVTRITGIRSAFTSEMWRESGYLFLWIAPLALSALCRVLPERAGKPLPEEGAARFGFWALVLSGGWAGAARLASGPAPAWIGTAGIAAACLVVLAGAAWLVVLLPLLGQGGWDRLRHAAGGGFLLFSSFAFPAWLLLVWLTAFRGIGSHLHLTLFDAALDDLAILGLGTMALLGFFARASRGHRAAFWLCSGGILSIVGGEAMGGIVQALSFTDPAVPFAAVGSLLKPFLWMRLIGWGLVEAGVVVYLFGFLGREAK